MQNSLSFGCSSPPDKQSRSGHFCQLRSTQGWEHNSPGCLTTLTLVPVPAMELGGILLLQMPSFRQKHWVCAHRRCCCVICYPNVTVALPSSNPGDVTALSVFLYPSPIAVFYCELLKTSCWISLQRQLCVRREQTHSCAGPGIRITERAHELFSGCQRQNCTTA